MQKLVAWIAAHPVLVVLLSVALSLAAAVPLVDFPSRSLRLQVNPSIASLLSPDDPQRQLQERLRKEFGDSEPIIVSVQLPDLFSAEAMRTIERLGKAYGGLPGVARVVSLATVPNVVADGEEIDLRSFTAQARTNPERIGTFAQRIAENPLYRSTLVSADGRKVAFALLTAGINERDFIETDYPARIRALTHEAAGEVPVWVTGAGVARALTASALLDAVRFTVPATFALMLVLLFLAFRNFLATLVAAMTVAMALLWTLSAAALLRVPFNLVTALVPALVTTLGLSYTIYLLSAYFSAQTREWLDDVPVRTRWVLNRAGLGLLLSGATTAAGFMALFVHGLPAIRGFAVLATLGSLFAVLLSLSFLPSTLTLLRCSRGMRAPPGEIWFANLARLLSSFARRRRFAIIAVSLALLPVAALLSTKIETGAEFIGSFAEEEPVRRDFEAVNADFGGANPLTVFIDTRVDDALAAPLLASQVDAFVQWLRQQPEVGAAVSYVDHLKLIHRSFSGDDPGAERIPEDPAAIKQLLVLGGNDALRRVLDPRLRSTIIEVRLRVDGSRPIAALVQRIDARLRSLPPALDAVVTGNSVLATRTVDKIASGQALSLSIASAVIWLLLSLMFLSLRAGFMALLPTLVPVAIYFGTLGAFGIPLSPTTALIACIVIGIAVDDTIQFLARFNADARAGADEAPAVASALGTVLRPVTLSTAALCMGFLVFAGSSLTTQAQFGLLSAFTLFLSWLTNITLTPALGSQLRIVTLWDSLRLDLGESPQDTIPVLSGLSLREARTFALMSRLEKHPAGRRLIRHGDDAHDVYVVVDGTLEVWVERGDERKSLATLGRGAVIGEAGYFGQRRTANVDTLEPVRLLRFDAEDLERLRLRYPKTAALILRNLNRVQAERLARLTSMIV